MIDVQVKENTNIVQSNFLLENRPKFTKDETRLFLTIIGAINKDDEDFKQLEIPVLEFAELWGMEIKTAYDRIKIALRGLVQKEFFIEGVNKKTGNKRFLSMSYMSMATYEQGEGYATIEISEMFKPYLLALKKNYTKYILENILNLSTVNAIRNYELLKQYESLGNRTFNIDEYKKYLGIENKYSLNADLKRYVLDAAVEEINANTDISVSYELIGRGKKAKIFFTIKSKSKIDISETKKNEDNVTLTKIILSDGTETYIDTRNIVNMNEANKTYPISEKKSLEDEYTTNPLFKTFSDEKERKEYITEYIFGITENMKERLLFEIVPVEVHEYDITQIKAIENILDNYNGEKDKLVSFVDDDLDDNLDEENIDWNLLKERKARSVSINCANLLKEFTIQEYEPRKKNIKTSNFLYYKQALKKWLENKYKN